VHVGKRQHGRRQHAIISEHASPYSNESWEPLPRNSQLNSATAEPSAQWNATRASA